MAAAEISSECADLKFQLHLLLYQSLHRFLVFCGELKKFLLVIGVELGQFLLVLLR